MVFSSLPEQLSKMRASLPYGLRSKKSTQGLTGILALWAAMRWGGMGKGERILLEVFHGGMFSRLPGRRKLALVTVS